MTNIRTTTQEGKTFYNAKDVFDSLGVHWAGRSSLNKIKAGEFKMVKAPIAIGDGTKTTTAWHYTLTEKGVKQLCKTRKLDNPLNSNKLVVNEQVVKNNEVAELKEQVQQLKQLFASAMMQTKSLHIPANSDTVVHVELTERAQIRSLVITHAKAKAAELGVTRSEDMNIFYDLSFNLLYNKYKQLRNFDIKQQADKLDISGLELAQNYGIISDLLKVAKELFA